MNLPIRFKERPEGSLGDAPVFQAPDERARIAPPPEPGSFGEQGCQSERVVLAGSALNSIITHPYTQAFEQLYRVLPEAGIHDQSLGAARRNFSIDLGSFRVPPQMSLLVFDFRPDIYRFNGIDAEDAVPVEERRFAAQAGFEVEIDNKHPGNLQFNLDPRPALPSDPSGSTVQRSRDATARASANDFARQRSQNFAAPSGAGTALLPQRPTRYGGSGLANPTAPMTIFVGENRVFAARFVVFRAIESPIAFIEFAFSGLLVSKNAIERYLECTKPV